MMRPSSPMIGSSLCEDSRRACREFCFASSGVWYGPPCLLMLEAEATLGLKASYESGEKGTLD